MTELITSALAIIALIILYPKAWRFVEPKKEDDSDLKNIEL